MNKYEISIWNDIYNSTLNRFEEEKIVVIGSDSMTSQNRALEPNLKSNVNGTNIFNFYLYYDYIDNHSGERVKNPFIKFLTNERKIKVYWDNKWYDLLVKSIVEDSVKHTFTYTCEDQYLTELSRTGFELEFNTELQNNIGTAQELVEKTLENTDWRFLEEDKIYQETEEPVYEIKILNNFEALKNPEDDSVFINSDNPALVYYSCAPDINNLKTKCQFYYNGTNTWQQDANDMLVINGDCYTVDVTWTKDLTNNTATAKINNINIFTIKFNTGLSQRYRAKRYVQSYKTIYNNIVDRYVNVYNYNNRKENLLGYQTTEYNDAVSVVNLMANSSNFSDLSGWIGSNDQELSFRLSPPISNQIVISNYTAKSFLKLDKTTAANTYVYNSGIQSNSQYLKNGFIVGETYIFRVKIKTGNEPANGTYITNNSYIEPVIRPYNKNYSPNEGSNDDFFTINPWDIQGNWYEFKLICKKSYSYEQIAKNSYGIGIFLKVKQSCWLEDVEFFKEVYGQNSEGQKVRVNPGEMQTQSIAQSVWKYFLANQSSGVTKDSLNYLYTSLEEWDEAIPVNNGYEKFGSITINQSNRFNILQSIAETFKCWITFIVEHDEQGYIKFDDQGRPCKYVQLKQTIGEDNGITFKYGIDLQGIKRDIKSSSISTKTIVSQNNNEFGKNGFCSIARSTQNYPRENFILNFDYYIRQGLLNGDALNNDLYGVAGLQYYRKLHNWNTEYINNLEIILNKKNTLTKQTATAKVYKQYISAAQQEKEDIEDNIMKLSGVDSFSGTQEYIRNHHDNIKVQTLMNSRTTIINNINNYQNLLNSVNNSIDVLTTVINEYETRQKQIIKDLSALNATFYKKYSRYIQEGTWKSEDHYNDDLYYLDALQVAYTSSRPQISYNINVIRLSGLEEFSSKKFNLGDVCYIQDTDYFGYLADGLTPYKESIYISEITSYFDSPEKDVIVVQNYKTQFDDLFQRITAATQSLEFNEGKYNKTADIVNTDGTIKSSVIQSTFDSNNDLVYGAQNESVTMDNTGITVTTKDDAVRQVKVTSGGLFVSNDGGMTWKNAVRGDGITADVITAGSLNVEQVTIYGKDSPSFLWDDKGISAFEVNSSGTNFSKYVRFDKYGIYGINNNSNFSPTSENDVYNTANFGLTWSKFFMKNSDGSGRSIEISTDKDIVVKSNNITRIVIGRIDPIVDQNNYGMQVRNAYGDLIFQCDTNGSNIAGWQLGAYKENGTEQYKYLKSGNIEMRSNGSIGCFEQSADTLQEVCYRVQTTQSFTAQNMRTKKDETIPASVYIFVFSSYVGNRITSKTTQKDYDSTENSKPEVRPSPQSTIQFLYNNKNYIVNVAWTNTIGKTTHTTQTIPINENKNNYITTYIYQFTLTATNKFSIPWNYGSSNDPYIKPKYIPPADFKWSIDQNGDAIFHEIMADGGTIAGWFIDNEKIYQTTNGQRNGPIKTQLNSQGTASQGGFDYSIITDAIQSAMATIGNVQLANGLINGQDIVQLANAVQYAINLANSAYSKAVAAQQAAASVPNHTHVISFTVTQTGTGGEDGHTHGYLLPKATTGGPQ